MLQVMQDSKFIKWVTLLCLEVSKWEFNMVSGSSLKMLVKSWTQLLSQFYLKTFKKVCLDLEINRFNIVKHSNSWWLRPFLTPITPLRPPWKCLFSTSPLHHLVLRNRCSISLSHRRCLSSKRRKTLSSSKMPNRPKLWLKLRIKFLQVSPRMKTLRTSLRTMSLSTF